MQKYYFWASVSQDLCALASITIETSSLLSLAFIALMHLDKTACNTAKKQLNHLKCSDKKREQHTYKGEMNHVKHQILVGDSELHQMTSLFLFLNKCLPLRC